MLLFWWVRYQFVTKKPVTGSADLYMLDRVDQIFLLLTGPTIFWYVSAIRVTIQIEEDASLRSIFEKHLIHILHLAQFLHELCDLAYSLCMKVWSYN